MQRPSDELIDRLAAEYVLGTLRGPARLRFQRWFAAGDAAQQARVRNAVRRWEDRLVHLADDVAPVDPSPRVWRDVASRIGTAATARRTRIWRGFALAASVALVAIGAWLWMGREPAVAWQTTAELRDAARPAALWSIDVDPMGTQLRARAQVPYALGADQAHELWALPASGGKPVSLGLLPQRGEIVRELTADQRAALAVSPRLAVSREPAGGSPTGAPTGPVLVVTERRTSA